MRGWHRRSAELAERSLTMVVITRTTRRTRGRRRRPPQLSGGSGVTCSLWSAPSSGYGPDPPPVLDAPTPDRSGHRALQVPGRVEVAPPFHRGSAAVQPGRGVHAEAGVRAGGLFFERQQVGDLGAEHPAEVGEAHIRAVDRVVGHPPGRVRPDRRGGGRRGQHRHQQVTVELLIHRAAGGSPGHSAHRAVQQSSPVGGDPLSDLDQAPVQVAVGAHHPHLGRR